MVFFYCTSMRAIRHYIVGRVSSRPNISSAMQNDEASSLAGETTEKERSFKQFEKLTPRFFAKDNQPFPMNPFFKPKPPLSDDTRTEMFKLYKGDPEKWTPRALADAFGISILRTEAILRLKAIQHNQAQGLIQSHYSYKMDYALGAETVTLSDTNPRREPIRETTLNPISPFLQFLEEEDSFTPNDAAILLQQNPFENITRKLDLSANKIFHTTVVPPTASVNTPNDSETICESGNIHNSRNNFMFVDTSRNQILVREKSGKLRTASTIERWNKVSSMFLIFFRNMVRQRISG